MTEARVWTTFLRLLPESRTAWSQTHNLWVASPALNHYIIGCTLITYLFISCIPGDYWLAIKTLYSLTPPHNFLGCHVPCVITSTYISISGETLKYALSAIRLHMGYILKWGTQCGIADISMHDSGITMVAFPTTLLRRQPGGANCFIIKFFFC